jgi:hypothetical protein
MDFMFTIMVKSTAFTADRPVMGTAVCRHRPENMFMGMVGINASIAGL